MPALLAGTARPRWSVVIPTCDDADVLPEALGSVLAQDPGPEAMQIVVVDDASTEADVAALVRDVAGDRVRVVRHAARLGAPATFTDGVRRATGRWVHVLHADDLVDPDFYAAYDDHLADHPAVMAVSRSRFVDGAGADLGLSGPLDAAGGYLVDAQRTITAQHPVNFVAVVVARAAYEAVGGFRPDLPHANDWELWARLAAHGPVAVVPGVHASYRRHAASDTTRLQASMTYLTDPVAAVGLARRGFADPTEGRAAQRQAHHHLAAYALDVGAQQAAAGRRRLALASAAWAVRLRPDRPTAAAAARLARTVLRPNG